MKSDKFSLNTFITCPNRKDSIFGKNVQFLLISIAFILYIEKEKI